MTEPATAARRALRQAIYDGLPQGADDDLYEIADGIYASVCRHLARQRDGSSLLTVEREHATDGTPCWCAPRVLRVEKKDR